jgi:hypothetical protein
MLLEIIPTGTTIIWSVLWNTETPASKISKISFPQRVSLLQHDTAWPRTSGWTAATVRCLGCIVLNIPTYKPDLELSHCHLFPKLRERLRGHNKASEDKAKTAVHLRFRYQTSQFYRSTWFLVNKCTEVGNKVQEIYLVWFRLIRVHIFIQSHEM